MKLEMSMIVLGAGLLVASLPLAFLVYPWLFFFMIIGGSLIIWSGFLRDDTT